MKNLKKHLYVIPMFLALAIVFLVPLAQARTEVIADPVPLDKGHLFQEPGGGIYTCVCGWTPQNCQPCAASGPTNPNAN